jgi:hypothetical protein
MKKMKCCEYSPWSLQQILDQESMLLKLFSFIADDGSLETLSSQVLELKGKARANPIGAPFRCFLLG